ncbi:DUF3800 domain-containing protein [Candidatus Dojkabacteria bacterium]|nr:DUF3800 domain-containing protein [Candidatus Dojkabacteria bacterium]
MFLFLDESKDSKGISVLGGILVPFNKVPEFERLFTKRRIETKIFGEVKWTNIDKNYESYIALLGDTLADKEVTYHSVCYRIEKYKYNIAYYLIRTVVWKIYNEENFVDEPFYVLFDNDSSFGREEIIKKVKEEAPKDKKFYFDLDFCDQGVSHVISGLQISDVITGAVRNRVNSNSLNKEQKCVVDYLVELNGCIPLDYRPDAFPKLFERKIQLFDPDEKS